MQEGTQNNLKPINHRWILNNSPYAADVQVSDRNIVANFYIISYVLFVVSNALPVVCPLSSEDV